MAYATVDELAAALRVTVQPSGLYSAETLQACLDAAAVEMDAAMDRGDDALAVDDALANRVNIARGVEWSKAQDATYGVVGMDATGALQAPTKTFKIWIAVLLPHTRHFGVA